jgi:hypothetical protein
MTELIPFKENLVAVWAGMSSNSHREDARSNPPWASKTRSGVCEPLVTPLSPHEASTQNHDINGIHPWLYRPQADVNHTFTFT